MVRDNKRGKALRKDSGPAPLVEGQDVDGVVVCEEAGGFGPVGRCCDGDMECGLCSFGDGGHLRDVGLDVDFCGGRD